MSAKKEENREMTRLLRKEMSRFTVDVGEVQINVSHGNVSLYGKVRSMKGHEANFETSIASLLKALRAQRGIRDVQAQWVLVY